MNNNNVNQRGHKLTLVNNKRYQSNQLVKVWIEMQKLKKKSIN